MRNSFRSTSHTSFAGAGARRALRIPVSPARVERPRTVLLVDPHADTRAVYGAFLRKHGFQVLCACDGAEGARMAMAHRPDVVVTELRLPGIDGWTMLERIKSHPDLAFTPMLAVTAAVAEVSRAEALASGFDELLAKPCIPERVLAEVRRITAGIRG